MQIREITVYLGNEPALDPVSVVQKANDFKSVIMLEGFKRSASAKSLLGVIAFQIKPGMRLRITAEGSDEEAAADAVASILAQPDGETG